MKYIKCECYDRIDRQGLSIQRGDPGPYDTILNMSTLNSQNKEDIPDGMPALVTTKGIRSSGFFTWMTLSTALTNYAVFRSDMTHVI